MYFDGLSYRRVAENVEEYFGRKTNPATVIRWVHDFADRAHEIVSGFRCISGVVVTERESDRNGNFASGNPSHGVPVSPTATQLEA